MPDSMSEYTYKRQTAQDFELSEAYKKAQADFATAIEENIRRTVKKLKDAGYTDEQINEAFNYAAARLFYGV